MPEPYKIYQGKKAQIPVYLTNKSTGRPYDLTAVTDIQVCFKNLDGTDYTASLLGSQIALIDVPKLGGFMITLTAIVTALLMPIDPATMDISLVTTDPTNPIGTQKPCAYAVIQDAC